MRLRRLRGYPEFGWRSPFEELERSRRQFDRLFERLGGELSKEPMAGVFPLINVTEDQDNYYVRAELPGTKADELDISVTGNSLSLSGERTIPAENASARYHRREREAGKFSRIIGLPTQIDPSGVDARCANGVLTVVLPKPEVEKPRQITVKAS